MSTPEERRRIWREEQEAKTAEGRRRIWARERQQQPATTQPSAPPAQPSIPTGQNLAVGAARGYLGLTEPVEAAGDIITRLATGDISPLKELGKGVITRAGQLYAASQPGGSAAAGAAQAAIDQEAAQRKARQFQQGNVPAIQRAVQEKRLAELEAQDPSLRGKLTRGAVSAAIQSAPYLAAGPGGVPALAATGAAMSLGAPENLPLNVALATLPAPALGRYLAPILRRIRGGKSIPSAVAEAVPPATGEAPPIVQRAMRQFEEAVQRIEASNLTPAQKAAELEKAIAQIGREASGIRPVSEATRRGYPPQMVMPENPNPIQQAGVLPRVFGEAEEALPALEAELGVSAAPSVSARGPGASLTGPAAESAAMEVGAEAAEATVKEPLSFGRAAAAAFRTPAQIFRSFRTAFDLSAAGNQGAVLGRAHPILAYRAFVKQLRAIKPSNRQAIDDAILNDPYTQLGRDFDLHIATGGAPEEAFMVKAFNKIPGIEASEATYRTYLDTLRLSVWKNYVKALESWGYTTADNPTAYRQAAQFINIATGRGSLKPGGALDKAMALGGDVLFAPRNLAAKFQLLNPDTYMNLAPGARRLVLKDALTSFGSLLGTATLLRAAGVKVGFNPRDDDFLTARFGNHRYDLTGGLKSEVRFVARMVSSVYNQSTSEGNLPAERPLNVATTYARGKLAPALGIAYDALKGTDIKGEKFSDKSAADIAFQFGPMIAEDLREGYKDSGLVGMAMSAPAFVGQRVSAYPDRAKAAFLDAPNPFRAEQKRAGEPRIYLQPQRAKDKTEKDETPQDFASRLARANAMLQEYGAKLVESNVYRSATAEQKKAAREHLERAIKTQSHQPRAKPGPLSPTAILSSVKASERREAAKKKPGQ